MNKSNILSTIIVIGIIVIAIILFIRSRNQFDLPKGNTAPLSEISEDSKQTVDMKTNENKKTTTKQSLTSTREIFVTDGVKHSIPLDAIKGGGPGKDGIPSIDEPKFISIEEANDKLTDDSVGLGLIIDGDERFYPYRILVWHEIVNDTVGGQAVAITYCPLCSTGVVFDRNVDGKTIEFGTSGLLWESNLLMYDRTADPKNESLWSQVLGEAVLGPATGTRLSIISADTVKYGGWKKKHPNTKVLSEDTGATRRYGVDPYEGYYTDNDNIIFPLSNTDDRLPNKDFVLGLELNGKFKAYRADDISEGVSTDSFASETVRLEKSDIGEVRMFIGEEKLSYIGGFWFSWVAVHPTTEVYKP